MGLVAKGEGMVPGFRGTKVLSVGALKDFLGGLVPGSRDPGALVPGFLVPGTTGTRGPGTKVPGSMDPGTKDPGSRDPGTKDSGPRYQDSWHQDLMSESRPIFGRICLHFRHPPHGSKDLGIPHRFNAIPASKTPILGPPDPGNPENLEKKIFESAA